MNTQNGGEKLFSLSSQSQKQFIAKLFSLFFVANKSHSFFYVGAALLLATAAVLRL